MALWTQAVLSARRHVPVVLVAIAILWGILLPIFGLTQAGIVPGSFHWIVQVFHLLVGLAAIGQAENLARRIREGQRQASWAIDDGGRVHGCRLTHN